MPFTSSPSLRHRFIIYSAFLDIRKSIFWYKKFSSSAALYCVAAFYRLLILSCCVSNCRPLSHYTTLSRCVRHLNFRDWLSPASKSRYGWKIAKSTLIKKKTTNNQPSVLSHFHIASRKDRHRHLMKIWASPFVTFFFEQSNCACTSLTFVILTKQNYYPCIKTKIICYGTYRLLLQVLTILSLSPQTLKNQSLLSTNKNLGFLVIVLMENIEKGSKCKAIVMPQCGNDYFLILLQLCNQEKWKYHN